MNGFEKELKTRILGVIPHIIVQTHDKPVDITGLDTVYAAVPFRATQALIQGSGQLQAIQLQGAEPELSSHVSAIAASMINGRFDDLQAGQYQVVVGRQLAAGLNVRVGDKVKLLLTDRTRYTPLGRMPVQRNFEVTGIFDSGSEADASVALIHLADLNRLLKTPSAQTSQRLYLHDAFDAAAVKQQLMLQNPSLKITDWRVSQGELFAAVKMEKNIMWLMLALIVAVAVFNIVSALVMMVNERRNEIATLQTMGMSKRDIVAIFIYQGMFKGCGGAIMGSICGVLLCMYLNPLMNALGIGMFNNPAYQVQGLPIDMQPVQISLIAGSAIVMSFLATLYPAYRAASMQPAEVLKHE